MCQKISTVEIQDTVDHRKSQISNIPKYLSLTRFEYPEEDLWATIFCSVYQ